MANSILSITDCSTTIDMLSIANGILTCEWMPSVAPLKGGGVWQSSPLVDGKRLSSRNFDNAVETFDLKISGVDQDAVITYIQNLVSMLEKAVAYWTTSWQKQPVWLEARGASETNSRFAVIKAYTIDGLANPFSQPFFGDCKSAMDKFTLVIERDHWIDQVPGTALCASINNLQGYLSSTTTGTYTVSQPSDDVLNTATAEISSGNVTFTSSIVSTYSRVGIQDDTVNVYAYESGLRFPSVTIPQGATITEAYLTVTSADDFDPTIERDLTILVGGELSTNAPIFNDNPSDFASRFANMTANSASFISDYGTWGVLGSTQTINGLEGVIQEIIDQYGWASGNALALFLWSFDYTYPTNYRSFQSLSSPPVLHVKYYSTAEEDAGHEDTCTGNVYIVNKHTQAQLTHIFVNDTGTGFSANLVGTALPWTLLPAVPANGDEIYFGIANNISTYGPFANLYFDLSVAASGYTLTWYNSYSGGWSALSTWSDKSINLDETGEFVVHFYCSNLYEATVNGVDGYWVKAVVTGAAGGTIPPVQETRGIYTGVVPFVEVDGDDMKGEIPSLARIRVSSVPSSYEHTTNIIVGSRSKSRGEEFTPYLNFSDTQNQPGITGGPAGLMVDDIQTPTGRCVSFSSSTDSDTWTYTDASITISQNISGQYHGTFHAYLRAKQTVGTYADFDIRLRHAINTTTVWTYSQQIYPSATTSGVGGRMVVFDFGIIELGSYSLSYDDNLGTITFQVGYRHNVDSLSTMEIIDLILIPADEWYGAFQSPARGVIGDMLSNGNILDIDSIGNPRTSRAIMRANGVGELLNEQYLAEWIKTTRGGPFLQARADQRLWFFVYHDAHTSSAESQLFSYGSFTFMVNVYIANRYLTMRGTL